MPFHVIAALIIGLLLPALETLRRGFGHWAVNFTTMFEDYAAGAGLLVGAVGCLRRATWARDWLVVVWSGVTFMMLISTVSQIERNWSGDLEPRAGLVLVLKLLLLLVCAAAVRSCLGGRRTEADSRIS